jgi:hypothetical protein
VAVLAVLAVLVALLASICLWQEVPVLPPLEEVL